MQSPPPPPPPQVVLSIWSTKGAEESFWSEQLVPKGQEKIFDCEQEPWGQGDLPPYLFLIQAQACVQAPVLYMGTPLQAESASEEVSLLGGVLCTGVGVSRSRIGQLATEVKENAGWYFPVYVRVRLLQRASSTCGSVAGLSTRRAEEGGLNCERWVACWAPEQPGEDGFYRVRVGQLSHSHKCCFYPLASLPRRRRQCST